MSVPTPAAAYQPTPQEMQEALTLEVGNLYLQLVEARTRNARLGQAVEELTARNLDLAKRVPADPPVGG